MAPQQPNSHYYILGCQPSTSFVTIQRNYSVLAAVWKNITTEGATEHGEHIEEAWKVLSNPVTRAQYDASINGSGVLAITANTSGNITQVGVLVSQNVTSSGAQNSQGQGGNVASNSTSRSAVVSPNFAQPTQEEDDDASSYILPHLRDFARAPINPNFQARDNLTSTTQSQQPWSPTSSQLEQNLDGYSPSISPPSPLSESSFVAQPGTQQQVGAPTTVLHSQGGIQSLPGHIQNTSGWFDSHKSPQQPVASSLAFFGQTANFGNGFAGYTEKKRRAISVIKNLQRLQMGHLDKFPDLKVQLDTLHQEIFDIHYTYPQEADNDYSCSGLRESGTEGRAVRAAAVAQRGLLVNAKETKIDQLMDTYQTYFNEFCANNRVVTTSMVEGGMLDELNQEKERQKAKELDLRTWQLQFGYKDKARRDGGIHLSREQRAAEDRFYRGLRNDAQPGENYDAKVTRVMADFQEVMNMHNPPGTFFRERGGGGAGGSRGGTTRGGATRGGGRGIETSRTMTESERVRTAYNAMIDRELADLDAVMGRIPRGTGPSYNDGSRGLGRGRGRCGYN